MVVSALSAPLSLGLLALGLDDALEVADPSDAHGGFGAWAWTTTTASIRKAITCRMGKLRFAGTGLAAAWPQRTNPVT
jgi:hypothetical protein